MNFNEFNWKIARTEVKANARNDFIQIISFDEKNKQVDLVVHTTKRASENAANLGVIEIIANHFNIPKSFLSLTKGRKSAIKWIECTQP